MSEEKKLQYVVKGVTEPSEVPSWARREQKYDELKNLVRSLEPGQTVIIEFDSLRAAERARNVVRDELNQEIGRAAIRTRLVSKKSSAEVEKPDMADVYFSRLNPMDIVETD